MSFLIRVDQVSKIFGEGQAHTVSGLSDISLDISEGSFAALSGPSGSGKTTLLNLIGCLAKPTKGRILFDGANTSELGENELSGLRLRKIGFIFQDFSLIPVLTCFENIEYVLWLQKMPGPERRKKVTAIAKRLGIDALLHRRPSSVSRGQQQRVAIARAMVHTPRIVLGDEFTANLDHRTAEHLMDFLKELNRDEHMTFLYATHDPVILSRASRVLKMRDGRLVP